MSNINNIIKEIEKLGETAKTVSAVTKNLKALFSETTEKEKQEIMLKLSKRRNKYTEAQKKNLMNINYFIASIKCKTKDEISKTFEKKKDKEGNRLGEKILNIVEKTGEHTGKIKAKFKNISRTKKDKVEIGKLESSSESTTEFDKLTKYLPPEFFSGKKSICYPGSSIDSSFADTMGKNVVHLDRDANAIKMLKNHGYKAINENIETHKKQYDLVLDSRPQVNAEFISKLVKAGGYVLVENAHAHGNYFNDSYEYEFIANISTEETTYTKVPEGNPFSSGDTGYYLFKKKESNIKPGKIKAFFTNIKRNKNNKSENKVTTKEEEQVNKGETEQVKTREEISLIDDTKTIIISDKEKRSINEKKAIINKKIKIMDKLIHETNMDSKVNPQDLSGLMESTGKAKQILEKETIGSRELGEVISKITQEINTFIKKYPQHLNITLGKEKEKGFWESIKEKNNLIRAKRNIEKQLKYIHGIISQNLAILPIGSSSHLLEIINETRSFLKTPGITSKQIQEKSQELREAFEAIKLISPLEENTSGKERNNKILEKKKKNLKTLVNIARKLNAEFHSKSKNEARDLDLLNIKNKAGDSAQSEFTSLEEINNLEKLLKIEIERVRKLLGVRVEVKENKIAPEDQFTEEEKKLMKEFENKSVEEISKIVEKEKDNPKMKNLFNKIRKSALILGIAGGLIGGIYEIAKKNAKKNRVYETETPVDKKIIKAPEKKKDQAKKLPDAPPPEEKFNVEKLQKHIPQNKLENIEYQEIISAVENISNAEIKKQVTSLLEAGDIVGLQEMYGMKRNSEYTSNQARGIIDQNTLNKIKNPLFGLKGQELLNNAEIPNDVKETYKSFLDGKISNEDLAYFILSKKTCKAYLFNKEHKLINDQKILIGENVGEEGEFTPYPYYKVSDNSKVYLRSPVINKNTPTGLFTTKKIIDIGDDFKVDGPKKGINIIPITNDGDAEERFKYHQWGIAIHPIYKTPGDPEKYENALKSIGIEDNSVTHGCPNVENFGIVFDNLSLGSRVYINHE
ncbi:MAG: hypothetical protein NTY80_04370 [candidate division SR1 bacterium]|nr:hypothetical protein [candidate division SR1 bacterium]